MPRSANLLGVEFSKSMKTALLQPGGVDLLDATRKDSGAFYREVTRLAVRHASRKVRNRADAEDIAQQTALSVWQHTDRFDPARASISHWVRLTANAALNRHLAGVYKTRAIMVEGRDIDEIDVIDPRGRDFDDRNDIYECLRSWFADDLELLDLLLAGYSLTECEQKLGLTRKAVVTE
jgi:RNA polymerase sigma factor (sigma-70 family)